MTRIVFLDIDGVLNHDALSARNDQLHLEKKCSTWHRASQSYTDGPQCYCFAPVNQIDPRCVDRLNTIVKLTGAKVVISSSWRRLYDHESINSILVKHGFRGEVIGETPDLASDPTWPEFHRTHDLRGNHCDRGHEIWEWLHKHREEVTGFVILDDCGDMARLKSLLVHTSDKVGLTDEDVQEATRLMERSDHVMEIIREETWR